MVLAIGTMHVGGITGQGRSREAVVTRIVGTPENLLVYLQEGAERVGGGCIPQYYFTLIRLAKSEKEVMFLLERDVAPSANPQ